ncbi:MAG TPA: FAD-dependent oxidoreductase, partial [Candidatus Limnocylindrales bacterium]|nr:FAD-dependent oxidoreductase [Candidatus Limnocylindrales bacterium]
PWSAGTAAMFLEDSTATDAGAAGETVFARGGPGAVSDALLAAARAAGAEVRTAAEVTSVSSHDGRVSGVVLAGGEALPARAVVAGIDPKR